MDGRRERKGERERERGHRNKRWMDGGERERKREREVLCHCLVRFVPPIPPKMMFSSRLASNATLMSQYFLLVFPQSIVELHQLFVDMSVLVETQGEMLDQIEYSVQQAHAYVEKGVKQLEKAKQSQKDSRKVTTKIAQPPTRAVPRTEKNPCLLCVCVCVCVCARARRCRGSFSTLSLSSLLPPPSSLLPPPSFLLPPPSSLLPL